MTFKSWLCFFMSAAILSAGGCGPGSSKPASNEDAVVTVNNYTITREEFENEFRDSSYGRTDTPEARQNFLNTLIDRKLILQYAQGEGLDKEKSFLKSIEKFWEQSLLKIALQRKSEEIEAKAVAGDWDARRAAQAAMMNEWMSGLRKAARITVRDAALKADAAANGGEPNE